jgi:hypothetical protein
MSKGTIAGIVAACVALGVAITLVALRLTE